MFAVIKYVCSSKFNSELNLISLVSFKAGLSAGISYFELVISIILCVLHVLFSVVFFSYIYTRTGPDPVTEEVYCQVYYEKHVAQ